MVDFHYFFSCSLQNPEILDPSSPVDKVSEILEKMHKQMEDFQQRAFQYKNYQKNFKVEVTKFEELEEAHAEVRLKQLLWGSLKDWDVSVDQWLQVSIAFCFVFFYFLISTCLCVCHASQNKDGWLKGKT